MNLAEVGEFGLIGRIARRVRPDAAVLIGIGDDAASVLPTSGAASLLTSDMLVEGIHFDLTYTDPVRLGRKTLSVNLSDIAAMGGDPRYFLMSLAIPPTITAEFIEAVVDGMLERADQFGVTLIGGDTCSARQDFTLSITLLGEQLPGRVIGRGGAQPGDLVYVTGTVGDAALGLCELRSGLRQSPAIERHLDPLPRVEVGRLLAEAGLPTAMIDVSDGLLADLGHILECSGVGAELAVDDLPLSGYFRETAGTVHPAPRELAMTGGEDYELLFTVPLDREMEVASLLSGNAVSVTRIGHIVAGETLHLHDRKGMPVTVSHRGYRHF